MANVELSNDTSSSSEINLTTEKVNVPRYQNAVAVVVMIVPVIAVDPTDGVKKIGVVAIRRSIEPKKGELAFPGGYLEYEDWKEAGIRELKEEAGIIAQAKKVSPFCLNSVEGGKKLLIFATTNILSEKKLPQFIPNEEVSERVILFSPTELAFPAHTETLKKFFQTLQKGE